MKTVVVDKDDLKKIAPFFTSPQGEKILDYAIPLFAVDKVNALYGRCCHEEGPKFAELLLKDLKIECVVNNPDMLEKLPSGPFITVSNHPFGGLDGIALLALMGKIRPDYKIMVNSVLTYIQAMSTNFIAVEPYSSKKGSKTNLSGIKESIRHLREGHPIGFFPAGGVSKIQPNLRIEDNPWAPNIVRLIQQIDVPVFPVYFHGHNSLMFNVMGLVSWKLRSLCLPREVFKARGKTIRVSVGEPISPEEQRRFATPEELGKYLRAKTYEAGRRFR